jgi:hypothetical protein
MPNPKYIYFRKGYQIKGTIFVVLIWKYESPELLNFIILFGNMLFPMLRASFKAEHYNSVLEIFG